jgi:hypothetical protein
MLTTLALLVACEREPMLTPSPPPPDVAADDTGLIPDHDPANPLREALGVPELDAASAAAWGRAAAARTADEEPPVGSPDAELRWTDDGGLEVPADLWGPSEPGQLGARFSPIRVRFPEVADDFFGWTWSSDIGPVWRGTAAGGFSAVVVRTEAGVAGWWETPTGTYEIADRDRTTAALVASPNACGVSGADEAIAPPELRRVGGQPNSFGMSVIDVLFLYEAAPGCDTSPPTQHCDAAARIALAHGASVTPQIIAGIAALKIQDALQRSQTGATVRVIGVEPLAVDLTPGGSAGAAIPWAEVNSPTNAAGIAVRAARETAKADFVVVLAAENAPAGAVLGFASLIPTTYASVGFPHALVYADVGAGDPVGPSTAGPAASWDLYSHEFGHMVGAHHDRANPPLPLLAWELASPSWNVGLPTTFAHVHCDGTTAHSSVMANTDANYCPGATTWIRYNRYSDPERTFPGTPHALGSLTPVVYNPPITDDRSKRTTENAARIRELAPAAADLRGTASIPTPAELTAPAPGANIGGGTTFTWTSAGASSTYVLEIGDITGVTFVSSATTATSLTVPGGASLGAGPHIVRLWTRPSTSTAWTWREQRYTSADRVTPCSREPVTWSLSPTYATATCSSGGVPACTYNSGGTGELTCRWDNAAGTADGVGAIYGAPTGTLRWYDLMVTGKDNAGARFCCLMSDLGTNIDTVDLHGSPLPDTFNLTPTGFPVTPWDGPLTVEVRGKGGGDTHFGTSSISSFLTERHRGGTGEDVAFGSDGAETWISGSGIDWFYGAGGNDLCVGDAGVNTCGGGTGADTLCDTSLASFLKGEDTPATGTSTLYYAAAATGTLDPSTLGNTTTVLCGHANHGLFADCTATTTLPAACAPWMAP